METYHRFSAPAGQTQNESTNLAFHDTAGAWTASLIDRAGSWENESTNSANPHPYTWSKNPYS